MIFNQDKSPATNASDALFKRMVVISTALSLAAAYGWLACFDRQADGSFYFHWRGSALAWIVVGFASSFYFWRKVWPAGHRADATRKDIIAGSIVLAVPCLWWLTFPLRYLSGQHFWDVMTGLIAAALVLSFGAWMVTRLIKAFEQSDTADLAAIKAEEQNADATPTEK
jgi:hypothetical protein